MKNSPVRRAADTGQHSKGWLLITTLCCGGFGIGNGNAIEMNSRHYRFWMALSGSKVRSGVQVEPPLNKERRVGSLLEIEIDSASRCSRKLRVSLVSASPAASRSPDDFHARVLEYAADLVRELLHELRQLGAASGSRPRTGCPRGTSSSDGGLRQRGRRNPPSTRPRPAACPAARRRRARPHTSGTSNPASLSVGTSGNGGSRLSAICASTRMLPRADVLARFLRLDDHHVDVAAEQRRDALAAARERDERPVRAGVLHEQLAHDPVAAADRAARLLELARALPSPRR